MTTTDITTTPTTTALDEGRLESFVGQVVVDRVAAISGRLLHLGDRLGLGRATGTPLNIILGARP